MIKNNKENRRVIFNDMMTSEVRHWGGLNNSPEIFRVAENDKDCEFSGDVIDKVLEMGGTVQFYDLESDDKWLLTSNGFDMGLRMYCEKNPNDEIDDLDGIDISNIIQYALFNQIIFG
jgi:hypothetical protein